MTRTTVKGGDWENRPANTSKPGKTNTTTGEVKKSNGGGYKMGGSAKKAYATGGQVVDDGKAVKMPRHFVSRPVANTTQSGTFKRGGKVKMAEGGNVPSEIADKMKTAENQRAAKDFERMEREENEAIRNIIPNAMRRGVNAVKDLFKSSSPPAGSVTKTEKSVTVSPSKKRGGSMKC